MTNPEDNEASGGIQIGDFLVPLLNYRHLIRHVTVAATSLAILAGAIYFFLQPTRWSASLDFGPVFAGAAAGRYPNGLAFASTDIVEPTVLDQVYDKNHIQDPCVRHEFRSGFVVDQASMDLQLLDLDYQARLAETRLSTVDRERLQNEYRARRQAMSIQFRLTWLRSDACRDVSAAVAAKALGEVLQTWAADADLKRGVLKVRVAVLTPAIFDTSTVDDQSRLVRADLIRSALIRVIGNVADVEALPGAELIRPGPDRASFAQVRARLEDLAQIHLDPLLAAAARGLGNDAVRWVEDSLAQATVQQKAAEDRANAYQTALREYSGVTAVPTIGAQPPQNSRDVQALMPQIDRTFVDRIVELSATNTTFRQDLTRSMVAARVSAVGTASKVNYYRQVLATLKTGSVSSLASADIDRRLAAIVADGKEQVRQFNVLYDELSRVSLRSGPSMYRIDRPAQIHAVTSFTLRSLALLILAVLFGTPLVLALGCLAHHAVRAIAKRPLRA